MFGFFRNFSDSDSDFLFTYKIFADEERIFKRVESCKLEVLFTGMEIEDLMLGLEL